MTLANSVRFRYLARLRELAGTDSETIDIPVGWTVSEMYDNLRRAHPGLPGREGVRAAVNQEFTDWSATVSSGDEVAFIPPVSGGVHARRLEAAVSHKGAGAICTFTGVVRDNSRGRSVTQLDYEAYAEMATAQMRRIGDEIAEQWPEARVAMAHRTGSLEIGEASVVVSVSCPHRAEAIAACKWGIDRLKESVPIWKKEHAADGTYWIEGDEAKLSS